MVINSHIHQNPVLSIKAALAVTEGTGLWAASLRFLLKPSLLYYKRASGVDPKP